jgi:hypothetical protein
MGQDVADSAVERIHCSQVCNYTNSVEVGGSGQSVACHVTEVTAKVLSDLLSVVYAEDCSLLSSQVTEVTASVVSDLVSVDSAGNCSRLSSQITEVTAGAVSHMVSLVHAEDCSCSCQAQIVENASAIVSNV